MSQAISQKAARGRSPGCLVVFFAVFALAGGGFSLFFIRPALEVWGARDWVEVPCQIVSSHVERQSSSDGDTFSVEITFTYEVGGTTYSSDRYQFLGVSSSGYEGKAEVVRRYPPGSRSVCYVNPDDLSQAVLYRGWSWEYLLALIPFLFLGVGVGGILFTLGKGRSKRAGSGKEWLPEAAVETVEDAFAVEGLPPIPAPGPVTLKPTATPLGKLVGVLVIALFWNGIVSVFVTEMWRNWRVGVFEGCTALFLIPFVLVGLVLLVLVPYQILALFNPRLELTLSEASLPLGGAVDVAWRFRGASGRISKLEITLEGREEATYRRGTNTSTARRVFATLPVAREESGMSIAAGRATLKVPSTSMHSFKARNNRIRWQLKVQGHIARWPDVSEEYEIVVRPLAMRESWR